MRALRVYCHTRCEGKRGRKKERLFCMHAPAYARTRLTYVLGSMCVDGTAASGVTPRTMRFVGRLCSFAYDRRSAKGNKICSNCSKESTSLKGIIPQSQINTSRMCEVLCAHSFCINIPLMRTLHINRALELYEVQTTILLTYRTYFMEIDMMPSPHRRTTSSTLEFKNDQFHSGCLFLHVQVP